MASNADLLGGIPRDKPIIVFDGVCVLCSANTRFVLKNDRVGRFRLAAMQNEVGAAVMRYAGLDPADPVSFIILDPPSEGGRVWMNSDAVLYLWSRLGWPWRAGVIFRLIPRPIRDGVYKLIARNRYKWFGKREECWVPSADEVARIL